MKSRMMIAVGGSAGSGVDRRGAFCSATPIGNAVGSAVSGDIRRIREYLSIGRLSFRVFGVVVKVAVFVVFGVGCVFLGNGTSSRIVQDAVGRITALT